MSHIVTCKVNMTNKGCLIKAVENLGLESMGDKEHTLYNNQRVTGIGFRLPEWRYPVVVKADGNAIYDNYKGNWGQQVELDKLVQRYSVEVAQEQAMLSGFTVHETVLSNGDIELEMESLATS